MVTTGAGTAPAALLAAVVGAGFLVLAWRSRPRPGTGRGLEPGPRARSWGPRSWGRRVGRAVRRRRWLLYLVAGLLLLARAGMAAGLAAAA